jgi:hypothetical protein
LEEEFLRRMKVGRRISRDDADRSEGEGGKERSEKLHSNLATERRLKEFSRVLEGCEGEQ